MTKLEQAAQQALGVGNSGFDHKTAADFLNGKTVSDEAVRKFVAASRWAHDEKAALSAMLLSVRGVLASREAEIALLKKALLEVEAAPQQEAQEPSNRDTVDVVGVRSNGEHVNLGKIAMPPRMKAREIAIEQFGSFKDDDGSDAEMCFGALEYFLEWLIQQGWSKAPQQEAQEPAAVVVPCYTPSGKRVALYSAKQDLPIGTQLYTAPQPSPTTKPAPQPAPAPLSEMPYEKRKAIQEGEQIGASDAWFHARHNMLDTLDRRNVFRAGFDRGWNAALAAQEGKT